ncbi:MAG: hypothetical protein ACOVOR_05025 [Rhabdochlamydiaceae bacterium]
MTMLIQDVQNIFEARYAFCNTPAEPSPSIKSVEQIASSVLGLFILIVFHQTMSPSTNPMNLAGKVIDFSRCFISPCYKITDIFKSVFKCFIISIAIGGIACGIVKIAHTTENALTQQNREIDIESCELHPNSLLTIEILFKTISLILIYQMRPHIGPSLRNRLILSTTLPFIISKFIAPERKNDSFLYKALTIYLIWLMLKNLYVSLTPLFR